MRNLRSKPTSVLGSRDTLMLLRVHSQVTSHLSEMPDHDPMHLEAPSSKKLGRLNVRRLIKVRKRPRSRMVMDDHCTVAVRIQDGDASRRQSNVRGKPTASKSQALGQRQGPSTRQPFIRRPRACRMRMEGRSKWTDAKAYLVRTRAKRLFLPSSSGFSPILYHTVTLLFFLSLKGRRDGRAPSRVSSWALET
ncbi:hypothetical protein CVT26_009086 [Gymnopilus dilepis]|uniref:Uncharacterized protein n=1 Tax=Gymnopilus dilepis TaxID=231916 RepID=A0A409WUH8_9AGAR|nr:hypothetical protein CVT26_009086 [Gymnopilus dilepis]